MYISEEQLNELEYYAKMTLVPIKELQKTPKDSADPVVELELKKEVGR
jgi:hypothetical protein